MFCESILKYHSHFVRVQCATGMTPQISLTGHNLTGNTKMPLVDSYTFTTTHLGRNTPSLELEAYKCVINFTVSIT